MTDTSARIDRALQTLRYTEPPADLMDALWALDPSPQLVARSRVRERLAGLREVFAALIHDSFATPGFAGARAVDLETRRQLFRHGDIDVVVEMHDAAEGHSVAIDVFGAPAGSWSAAVVVTGSSEPMFASARDDRITVTVASAPLEVTVFDDDRSIRCGLNDETSDA